MMQTTCEFLGIYVDTIERVVKTCEDAMEKLGFDISEIDDMNDYAKQEIEEIGDFSYITNSIIAAYYMAAEYMIHQKYPSLGVNYYVDGCYSSFDVDELEAMTEQEIVENWEKALNTIPYDEIAAKIGWGFSDEDLQELMRLHKAGICREQIENLLTDCNFHFECGEWHSGNYVIREE